VSRLLGAIVYNWPLKLAAIALATLLYVGLIFSENAQSSPVSIKIDAVNPPRDTIMIGALGEVTNIRYFVSDQANVAVQSSNFTATVDLSAVQPGPQAQSVRISVTSADPRIQVLSSTPAFVSVHLEKVASTDVAVEVVPGPVPDGLEIGDPKPSLDKVTVRGAATDIAKVVAVRVDVAIDSSGIDIDRDFPMTPVDQLGERVNNVEVDPAVIHVQMAVVKDQRTATVPITANIVGALAPGFDVRRITLSSPTIQIEGDALVLGDVQDVRTQPISLDGRTADFDVTVGFDQPQGVTVIAPPTVDVHVQIIPVNASRTFSAGIVLGGARPDRQYALSIPGANVTIGGAPAALDGLNGATLSLTANVADLEPGTHAETLTISLQAGLTVIAISPATVTVVVTAAPPGSAAPPASGGG
jgi:YbbR domain-containing protein